MYPDVMKRRALAHRSGVLSRPSRSGSSPMHSRMVRQADVILVSLMAMSGSSLMALVLSVEDNLRFLRS